MRASRSATVVQVMLVPAELTKGKAAQLMKSTSAIDYASSNRSSMDSRQATSAGRSDKLAVHALCELCPDTGILTRSTRRARAERGELLAASGMCASVRC